MGSTPEEINAECARQFDCSPDTRKRLERELTAHDVTLSSFQIDRYEVTNKQFADFLTRIAATLDIREDRDSHVPRFVDDRASKRLIADLHSQWSGIELVSAGRFAARPSMASKPVVQVTWDGASRYCQALGRRLPTEAEWEFAARGKTRRFYPWGAAAPTCEGVVFGREKDAGCEHLPQQTDNVSTAPQDVTPEGIHGLGGNVMEWVHDAFSRPNYEDCGECVNPRSTEPGVPPDEEYRVARGGSFKADALLCRAATRSRWKRIEVQDGIGFRCAAD